MTIEQLRNQDKKHAQVIANYLIKRIETDQCLKEKIETTTKTLKGCVKYCKNEARKQAEDGCAMIPDDEVFQWAVHYFIEDSIKENETPSISNSKIKNEKNNTQKSTSDTKKDKDVKKKLVEQLSLFDLD